MATSLAHPQPASVEIHLIPSPGRPIDRKRDSLFAALDGSRLQVAGEELEVEVYSITDAVAGRWVQLGFRHTDEHFITLQLPRQAGFAQAQKALLTMVAETPEIAAAAAHRAA